MWLALSVWEKVRDETGGSRAQVTQMPAGKPRGWVLFQVQVEGSRRLSLTSPPKQA